MNFTSKELLEKIKEFEGCRLEAYQDAAGVWTIGYGHTKDVKKGDKITQWYADDLLQQDIHEAERQVLALGVCETQGQLDALTDFVFNLGFLKLKISTLLEVIRAKMPAEVICRQFTRWVYADGKRLKGLVIRRNWEKKRFFAPTPLLRHMKEDQEKLNNQN